MNSAVRLRPIGAAEVQPSISGPPRAAGNRNGQRDAAPPPSSSQRATIPAQRAVRTAASAAKPVSETEVANQSLENASSASAQSRESRRNAGSAAGTSGQSSSIHAEGTPRRSGGGESHQAQEGGAGRDQRRRARGLRRLSAQGDEPLRLRMRPPLQLASLLRSLPARADAVQHRRTGWERRARDEPAGEDHVPARRAVPGVEVAVLRQELQLGESGFGGLVARER